MQTLIQIVVTTTVPTMECPHQWTDLKKNNKNKHWFQHSSLKGQTSNHSKPWFLPPSNKNMLWVSHNISSIWHHCPPFFTSWNPQLSQPAETRKTTNLPATPSTAKSTDGTPWQIVARAVDLLGIEVLRHLKGKPMESASMLGGLGGWGGVMGPLEMAL